jgi:hypothetical protein
MDISGISAASSHAASQQGMQSLAPHKHGGHRSHSISDLDAQSSSVTSAPSSTGKVGSKVNVTA